MILLVHLLLGALIGQKINSPILAIILAFLSHYFLDIFPHVEYTIENIEKMQWRKVIPEILKVILDFSGGILLVFMFSKNQPIIYVCAFFAILPDGLSLLRPIVKSVILEKHSQFHQEKVHFLKHKKISYFWRIFSQVIAVIAFIILFKI